MRNRYILLSMATILACTAFFHADSMARASSIPVRLDSITPLQLSGGSSGLKARVTVTDTTNLDISYQTGCSIAPPLFLRSNVTGAVFRAQPVEQPAGNTCIAGQPVLHPGRPVSLTFQYQLEGYTGASSDALVGIPDDTYQATLQFTYTLVTGDPAHRYRMSRYGHLMDTFSTTWSLTNSVAVQTSGTSSRTGSTTSSSSTSSVGPFSPKVLVIDYNATGTSDDGSTALTTALINAYKTGSAYHGASTYSAHFQVYATYHENNQVPQLSSGQADYAAIFAKYNICNLVLNKGVGFVWLWANGTGGFLEWVATGPSFSQTWGTNVPTCGSHTVVTFGFNYERAVAEAFHSTAHYMEGTQGLFGYAFGPVDTADPNGLDMWDMFDGQGARYGGYTGALNTTSARCGNVHFPPNATQGYDYSNSTVVQSDCASFNPGMPGAERYVQTSVTTWRSFPCDPSMASGTFDCDQESYLMWWMQNMPGYGNTTYDCGGNPMPNWWQYALAFDTVTTTTSNDCSRVVAVTPSTTSGPVGTKVTVTGSTFGAGEAVALYWDSRSSAALAITTASSTGAISASFVVPSSTAGTHKIYAVGQTSGDNGMATFQVQAHR